MLKNVKSQYFSKKLFSHIDDKRKLEIVKINKILQNNIDVNINNYKLFAGKYLIYEEDGKGKEYRIYDDMLIAEAEYKDGKKNGKGKEYENSKVRFEGEYLNGKKHGKGKEYDSSGKIIFVGEYKNGNRWNGKAFGSDDISTELKKCKERKLECKLIDGKGIIKKYDNFGKLIFEGEYINGELNGKCKQYSEENQENILFEGEYLKGKKWNGKGYDTKGNLVYELSNGKGNIKEYESSDNYLKYEYDYLNGEKNGKGKIYGYKGRIIFDGEYKNNKKNGSGKEYNNETGELLFEGEYLYDWKIKGKEYLKGKLKR